MKHFAKLLAIGMVLLLCVSVLCMPASAATIKVYDKDIHLSDDEGDGNGWMMIADDPGFYFDGAGGAVHKSPSQWTATDKADKAFGWKYDAADKKEGNSSLSQTYSTGFFFYWLSELSGETLDLTNTQYLLMDLYVEDPEIFLAASDIRIDFTDSTDKNNMKWDTCNVNVSKDTIKGLFLRKGWNTLRLYLSNTDEMANIDLTKITGLRFFAVDLTSGTHTIKLDNVHIVSKGYTTQEANATTTTTKAPTTTTKKPVAEATTTASATTTAEQPAETTAPTVQTTTVSDVTESTTASAEDTARTTTASAAVESEVEAESQTGTESSDATTVTDPKPDGGIPAWVWIVVGVAVVVIAAVVIVVAKKKK